MSFLIDSNEALRSVTSVPAVRRRMAQSFLSASSEGRHVTVLVLGVDNLEVASDAEGLSEEHLLKLCRRQLNDSSLREAGPLHTYRDGARLVALFELPLDHVELIARRTILASRRLPCEERYIDLSLSAGIAENRADMELYFETLVGVAEEGLAVARARGGECCVHTMLYRSLQEMEERDESALSGRQKVARSGRPTTIAHEPAAREPERPAWLADDDAEASHEETFAPRPLSETFSVAFEPTGQTDSEAEIETRAQALAHQITSRALSELRLEYESRLAEERSLRAELASAGSGGDVELLKLRIQKLSKSLELTERRLLEVCKLKDIDPGVSSIYREVQGLSGEDESYAVKKEMMKNIFEANLQIQRQAG